ncbi:FAD-dependent oxidoreductase [Kribbella solani]|uniref:NAD(P)/FAD-dependent oxidoreductase n=1 Tax=Kribbella solani TaxID=236067 RepID=UPI0029BE3A49|nr:FAD-dependent oxidoreductase [Kribbella solani]MDX3005613.1 FAD-dependent oxidoreductase [Kribbella solani]
MTTKDAGRGQVAGRAGHVAGAGYAGQVVVAGAGHAGVQVAASLRAGGFAGAITLVDDDSDHPYQRPPLSKDFVADTAVAPLPLRAEKFFADSNVMLRDGSAIREIDRRAKQLILQDSAVLDYSTLVLATGARCRPLDVPGAHLRGIHQLRTLRDARTLRELLTRARSVVVVGAGFIGLEFAAAVRGRGLAVTVLETGDRPLARALTAPMSGHLAAAHLSMGTNLRCNETVARITGTAAGDVTAVVGSSGTSYPADLVLVGIGVQPRDELARTAGLPVDNGILVDDRLRTPDPAIYAAGDCARFRDPASGERIRLESVQNATDHGRHIAATLLGNDDAYEALPLFWSNQGRLRLQVAGLSGAATHTVVTGDPDRFSVLCFRDDRLIAVESLNSPGDHVAARRVLTAGTAPSLARAAQNGFSLKQYAQDATTSGVDHVR